MTTFKLYIDGRQAVTACLERPSTDLCENPAVFVFGHGAGAGMNHEFMEDMSARFLAAGLAVFRYQFPYMEAGKSRPDPRPHLLATIKQAIDTAKEMVPDACIIAGGKSMGGRMSSLLASQDSTLGISGLAFIGFPLHPPKKISLERADHLTKIHIPKLFIQGTRDALADLASISAVVQGLPSAKMHIIEGGDHSFQVLKRSGRTPDDVRDEICGTLINFVKSLQP